MRELLFTAHEEYELKARDIPLEIVEEVLEHPDAVKDGKQGRKAFQKIIGDPSLKKPMLYRVIVELRGEAAIVITAYKTSRIAKYQEGLKK